MVRAAWAWTRVLGGVGILAFVLWRLGTSAFLDSLHLLTGWLSTRWDLGFSVSGFWAAFFGGLVVGFVSVILSLLLPRAATAE